MNNSAFLSDSLNVTVEYRLESKHDFISDEEPLKYDNRQFESEEQKKYNSINDDDKYIMRSATTRKWSIKFK